MQPDSSPLTFERQCKGYYPVHRIRKKSDPSLTAPRQPALSPCPCGLMTATGTHSVCASIMILQLYVPIISLNVLKENPEFQTIYIILSMRIFPIVFGFYTNA